MSVGARVLKWQHFRPQVVYTPKSGTFYPNAGAAGAACDGYASRYGVAESWSALVVGPGKLASDSVDGMQVLIVAYSDLYTYNTIDRCIFSFDLSSIKAGSIFQSGYVQLLLTTKANTWPEIAPTYNVFGAYPLDPGHLVMGDYNRVYADPLAAAIDYASLAAGAWAQWDLNAAGLAYLQAARVNSLCLREATYDAPVVTPAWYASKSTVVVWYTADKGTAERPKLYLTWLEPD